LDFIYRVTFNKAGDKLLSCGYGGNIYVWNVADGKLLWETHLERVSNWVEYSPDGTRIIVAGGDGNAYLLDLPVAAR